MHEAGLARAVARTIQERGLSVDDVRLLVRGGHHSADDFDAAMRAYLTDDLGPAAESVEIVHVAFAHLCASCGGTFDAADLDVDCPACGGPAMPSMLDEQVEIELR